MPPGRISSMGLKLWVGLWVERLTCATLFDPLRLQEQGCRKTVGTILAPISSRLLTRTVVHILI
jgi:hypothetical protein